jgi:hypothetical protein
MSNVYLPLSCWPFFNVFEQVCHNKGHNEEEICVESLCLSKEEIPGKIKCEFYFIWLQLSFVFVPPVDPLSFLMFVPGEGGGGWY